MKQMSVRFFGLLIVVAGLMGGDSAASGGAVWQEDIDQFRVSDNPYEGWKIVSGEARVSTEQSPHAVIFTNPEKPDISAYHYIPFLNAEENPESYLQITAHFEDDSLNQYGEAGNVSSDGGMFGAFTSGITTYTLAQYPYFTENTDKKKSWAFKLWASVKSFRIEEIALVQEISDGITMRLESPPETEGLEAGQKVIITLHTTESSLEEQETIQADLIARTGTPRKTIQPWNGSGGPTIELKKVSKGVHTAEILLDAQTKELIQQNMRLPAFGVRMQQGARPMTAWLVYRDKTGGADQAATDWQNKAGSDTGSHEVWHTLTKGENLALGRPLRYIPGPDYRLTTDEHDAYDLTDGKLSTRKDDRIWFQKDAVGWYGAGGAIPTVTILADLGKVEPVGQISIRLLGGKEQNSLRLPNRIEFLASEDGSRYHQLQQMGKLMPAEQALSDFRTAFYIPEEGKTFVHAFSCNEAVRARYVAIRIQPETSVFCDQIAILKASGRTALKSLTSYPAKSFFTKGVAAQFRNPELTLFPGVHVHNWVIFESYEEKAHNDLKVKIDLPASLRILPDPALRIDQITGAAGRYVVQVSSQEPLKEMRFPLYFEKEGEAPISPKEQAVLTALVDGVASHAIAFPIRERILPEIVPVERLKTSLAWMGEKTQLAWPDFYNDFRKLGFNAVSTFPRLWQNRNSKRTWIDERKTEGLKLTTEGRTHGYQVVMNDSPFHEMMHTFQAAKREGTLKPEDAQGFFLKDANGRETESPNPFYRGFFYTQEMGRVRDIAREIRPDQVFWDIELWWKSASNARDDQGVARRWKESGKEWDDFLTDAGTEMLRDLHSALREGMGERPMPIVGLYGAYATQPHPCDSLFEWRKIYPHFINVSMPSLYVQGRAADVRARIRDEYSVVQNNIIPWLTAGTYGPVAPPAIESMVLETVLNGAGGVTWYEYRDFDALHFYHYARAMATLGRFGKLLNEGVPTAYEGDNPALTYTCFASKEEALILVGNYNRAPQTSTTLHSIFPDAVTSRVDIDHPLSHGVPGKTWKAEVPANQYVLFYQKRNEQTQ